MRFQENLKGILGETWSVEELYFGLGDFDFGVLNTDCLQQNTNQTYMANAKSLKTSNLIAPKTRVICAFNLTETKSNKVCYNWPFFLSNFSCF